MEERIIKDINNLLTQLFQKMKEAGYEWDAEKKELKKIESYSLRNIIKDKPSPAIKKVVDSLTAWNKEDERIYQSIMDDTVQENQLNGEQTNWIRDIKYRYFPKSKQEWKQENIGDLTDFEAVMMHIGGSFFGPHAGLDPNDTNTIKEQANLLLELVPSKEWSEEDRIHLGNCIALIQRLSDSEANWLKSLKGRYTWKPSDEQIEALESATENCAYSE